MGGEIDEGLVNLRCDLTALIVTEYGIFATKETLPCTVYCKWSNERSTLLGSSHGAENFGDMTLWTDWQGHRI